MRSRKKLAAVLSLFSFASARIALTVGNAGQGLNADCYETMMCDYSVAF